ncbi:hypothetical protein SPRG_05566 [Saprolegnia parasitica CBS 223.65]|uniref:Ion transport domain-containing protein n=1 Tax=Saprolegnia parasitica (strain CBS 223.65) TaxID=695850 RepID=A0A067CGI7_SAPPC|nr:hypothetical protein SPRG_05566 [Saprolegnia parasitica CBS 223.65]KDO29613.1 hypothetical protein SPRG_05566 [Saprolegnia parasitica CBS 223.65]|eukprot:XP_012199673.1 hypothetical protein SPRG_05566 [Saprolegnia parasitica CBS 223.65]
MLEEQPSPRYNEPQPEDIDGDRPTERCTIEELHIDMDDQHAQMPNLGVDEYLQRLVSAIDQTRGPNEAPSDFYNRRIATLATAETLLDECLEMDRKRKFVNLHLDRQDEPSQESTQALTQGSNDSGSTELRDFEDKAIMTRKKKLLDHPVMRVAVHLKWQVFGLRMYCEQLLMYWLLLFTMVLSLSMGLGVSPESTYNDLFIGWLTTCSFLIIAAFATRFLSWKTNWTMFGRINNTFLGLSVLYFYVFEIRELAADEDGPDATKGFLHVHSHYCVVVPARFVKSAIDLLRGKSTSPYLESYWNRIQLPTFVFVLIYVFCEFTAPFSANMRTYAGIPAVSLLWVMGLQYLEVFGSISYLLPMMRHMICGYTCAYYLLFKTQGNDPVFAPYATVPQCFVTTYLVTFAQINLEPFKALRTPSQYMLGYLLLLTHATISIVMLLNVLIAMMNKTMGNYLEEAKHEARVTFAECVLRMEKTKTFETTDEDFEAVVDEEKIGTLLEHTRQHREVSLAANRCATCCVNEAREAHKESLLSAIHERDIILRAIYGGGKHVHNAVAMLDAKITAVSGRDDWTKNK